MNNVPLPKNLPLLVSDPRPNIREAAAKVLQESPPVEQCLAILGRHLKIKVTFSEPVTLETGKKGWHSTGPRTKTMFNGLKTDTVHVINKFFQHYSGLCYCRISNGRNGRWFEVLDKVVSYEPVIDKVSLDEFTSFEQFKSRFDPLFITDAMIQKLWDGTSSQHGGEIQALGLP